MKRREFLQVAAAASAGVVATTPSVHASESVTRFRMAFAPHFGMFASSAGDDLVDQLKFAADQGFTAWEDNLMRDRSVADQERVAAAMQQLDMKMGVISALRGIKKAVSFAGDNAKERDIIVQALRDVVPVAKRVNATHMTVVCGLSDPKLPRDYQTANAIDLLKRCCDVVEPHGLVMVLEPLNSKKNHPGMFLSESPHAYQICKAVGRPSCKILFDIYHQQITEGNLIPNIDLCWDEIGYFQCGDNPGRKEPGTGEIHYGNVFQHLADAGYDGIVGMEHGNSKPGVAGEQAVIDAYRSVDPA
ncbi:Hydroxypyruvate isomerase [Crateriforma conspicua]|uniref:Hydroxypyruvate isomerase n=2 Tax=Crateriforma conspicua TaxID=2527996 RepID=A0A5C5Y663_9PLAN|nr:Hydroxypyruvate isomerase [Crateriforma conspicua]